LKTEFKSILQKQGILRGFLRNQTNQDEDRLRSRFDP
jgi:hypothetical protein